METFWFFETTNDTKDCKALKASNITFCSNRDFKQKIVS